MAKFKVGDRVRQVGDEFWRGMTGVYDGRRESGYEGGELYDYFVPDAGSRYSDGTPILSSLQGRPCSMKIDSFELIVDEAELTELRQFKADAIARYPDLEWDGEIVKYAKQLFDAAYPDNSDWESSAVRDGWIRAAQWARDNPR